MNLRLAIVALTAVMFPVLVNAQDEFEKILRAKALIENNQPSEALNFLNTLISAKKDGRYFQLRGEAYTSLGNFDSAISDFREASNLIPGSGEYGLACLYALKGDFKSSMLHLGNNIQSQFRKSEKEIMLDPVFGAAENSPEWRVFWKTDHYSLPEKSVREVEYFLGRNMIDDATQVVDMLGKEYASDNNSIYARALLYGSTGRYEEAVSLLNGLLARERDNASWLGLLAKIQFSSGNYAGASVTLGRMIGLEVPDAGLFLRRAECFRKTGEYTKAAADAEKYIALYPSGREGLSLAGKIEAENGNNLRAIEYFSENIKMNPGNPQCYVDRADSYFISRSWNYAISDYSMALDLQPKNPEVWLNKGIALLNTGRKEDACSDFRKALEMGNKRASAFISRNCIE